MADIYEGKCDARFEHISINYDASAGFLANDRSLEFACGPQTFTFTTSDPWMSDRFPWGIELVDGGTARVANAIADALDIICRHWEDEGGGFWAAVRKVKTALKFDIDRFCAS